MHSLAASRYSLVKACPRKKRCGARICTPGCRRPGLECRSRVMIVRASTRNGRLGTERHVCAGCFVMCWTESFCWIDFSRTSDENNAHVSAQFSTGLHLTYH